MALKFPKFNLNMIFVFHPGIIISEVDFKITKISKFSWKNIPQNLWIHASYKIQNKIKGLLRPNFGNKISQNFEMK